MVIELLSTSPDFTFQLGERVGEQLEGDEILLLSGDLGAGKTLMTKGIAKSIGINPGEVVSPTFTLMNRFQGKFSFYHVDLYRLGEQGEGSLCSLPEVDDYIGDGVILLEWAQYLDASYFQLSKVVDIRFHITSEDHRTIRIETSLEYLKGSKFRIILP